MELYREIKSGDQVLDIEQTVLNPMLRFLVEYKAGYEREERGKDTVEALLTEAFITKVPSDEHRDLSTFVLGPRTFTLPQLSQMLQRLCMEVNWDFFNTNVELISKSCADDASALGVPISADSFEILWNEVTDVYLGYLRGMVMRGQGFDILEIVPRNSETGLTKVLPSEGYLKTKTLIDDPTTLKVTFILGVANASDKLPKPLKQQWFIFTRYYLPHLHKADILGSLQYEECVMTLREAKIWASAFAVEQPDVLREAEKAALQEMWRKLYLTGMMDEWRWNPSDWKD
ncbi:hypothetical protein IFR05_000110 [Cadophora sp. M221]|nr:hypothetical protein IFR05_000110 [Cadophora sp. M221]